MPHGSILGPLLFLIYVNDTSGVVNNRLLLYADNKLSLHLGKTESVLFGSKLKLRSKSNLNVSCKGKDIEPKQSVK